MVDKFLAVIEYYNNYKKRITGTEEALKEA